MGLARDGRGTDQSAAGRGKKTGPNPTDRGKSGVKRSLLVEGHGVPLGLVADGANRHDMKLLRSTVESLVAVRSEPTKERQQGMCLDAGYDYDEVYAILNEFGFTPHVRARTRAWGRGESHRTGSRVQSAQVGGGAVALLDEPLSSPVDPLG